MATRGTGGSRATKVHFGDGSGRPLTGEIGAKFGFSTGERGEGVEIRVVDGCCCCGGGGDRWRPGDISRVRRVLRAGEGDFLRSPVAVWARNTMTVAIVVLEAVGLVGFRGG